MPSEVTTVTGPENKSTANASSERVEKREFVRFSRKNRALHGCMVVAFLSLSLTGLTLKFSYTNWAVWLSRLMGGFETAGFIHRTAALIMFGAFLTHLQDLYRQ